MPESGSSQKRVSGGVFLPLLLVVSALLVWFGFQATQLIRERQQVDALRANQTPVYQNAMRMRRQLDVLAAGTQRLSDAGNANARAITDSLRQRGITINPAATERN
jgi:type II secretory pathway component PulL